MPIICSFCGKESYAYRIRIKDDGTKQEGCVKCVTQGPSRTLLNQQVPGIPFKCTVAHWHDMDERKIDRNAGDGQLHVYRDHGRHSVVMPGMR